MPRTTIRTGILRPGPDAFLAGRRGVRAGRLDAARRAGAAADGVPSGYRGPMAPLRLSVLDQSPISEGSSGAQALNDTLDLARLADDLGYHRYWVAEHHGGADARRARAPEVLIGPIAAATRRIRVGSGGVMLPHYSPLKVAEAFSVLSGLFPGPHRPRASAAPRAPTR